MTINKEEVVQSILEQIEYENLNDGMQEVAEVLGIDAVRKLIKDCGRA